MDEFNMLKKQIILVLALVFTATTFAQKAKILEGNFKDLKGITEYNLVFDYSDLEKPKYDNEEEKAGDSERFKKPWFADREKRFEPKFIHSFNKRYNKFQVGKDLTDAEYTMKVRTTRIWAGYNSGGLRRPSELDAIISVYKTGAPEDVLFSVKYTQVEGYGAMGYDYKSGYRISESYAKLAKTLAKTINKKAW